MPWVSGRQDDFQEIKDREPRTQSSIDPESGRAGAGPAKLPEGHQAAADGNNYNKVMHLWFPHL